jgi:hypothetical protein
MKRPISFRSRLAANLAAFVSIWFAIGLVAVAFPPAVLAQPFNPVPSQPGFAGGLRLSGAYVAYGSPTVADLDKDGKQEIVVGGTDGRLYAIRPDGTLLWSFDTAAAINPLVTHQGKSLIDSAPAIADLDGDGWLEIVVGVGAPAGVFGYNGGMIVLDHTGHMRSGWPQITADQIGPGMGGPDGYIEGFYSSPALGDIDGDGDLEIIAGSWDMRVYAWHSDGTLVTGWPRFVYDTVWSSPALADIDNDGHLEIIIGVDAHNPDGGHLYVFRGDGTLQPGFPILIDQTIYSSPAVADLSGDGKSDIVVGTGNFYSGKGYAVYAWDAQGNLLPGWPVATGGYVLSAPTVGDIDGDGKPEVIVGCNDGKVYAFRGDGRPMAGWPVVAQDNLGNIGPLNYSSPVLANFDNDSLPEVFINNYCDTIVIDGNGALLTHVGNSAPSGKPSMYMFNAWCLGTTPVVQDLDGDGRLEVVRAGGVYDAQRQIISNALVYVWKLGKSSIAASATANIAWPMFRRNAAHHASYLPQRALDARIVSHTLPANLASGESRQVQVTIENTGTQTWTAATGIHLVAAAEDTLTPSQRVSLAANESVAPGQSKTFSFQLRAPTQGGRYLTSWRMADNSNQAFGSAAYKAVKVGSEPSFYVLSKKTAPGPGGVYAGGLAPQLSLPNGYWNWKEVKSFAFTSDHRGYQMLDYQGGVWQGGSAPAPGGHGFVSDAQELLTNDGVSYYILDRYGKLTRSAGASELTPAPPTFSTQIVRSGALTPDGKGIYILLSDGTVHTGGNAKPFTGLPLFDDGSAKKIKLTTDGKGAYILDAHGHVWQVGSAPQLTPTYAYHMNDDWARDVELTDDGRGYYLLDREGRIYTGGAAVAPTMNLTPIWPGEDVAVDLAVVDSQTLHTMQLMPNGVNAMTTPGQPRSQTIQVNVSDSTCRWTASSNQSWLQVNSSSGTGPGSFTITMQANQTGTVEGQITVTDSAGVYDPATITIRLTVVKNLVRTFLPLTLR